MPILSEDTARWKSLLYVIDLQESFPQGGNGLFQPLDSSLRWNDDPKSFVEHAASVKHGAVGMATEPFSALVVIYGHACAGMTRGEFPLRGNDH